MGAWHEGVFPPITEPLIENADICVVDHMEKDG